MPDPANPAVHRQRPLASAHALHLAAGATTDVGAVRSENQDAFGVLPAVAIASGDVRGRVVSQPAVFVVADGMGGHEAGAEASNVAVDTAMSAFGPSFRQRPDRLELLREAITSANAAVWACANVGSYRRQMGTTCTLLLVADGHAYVGHVGDSRAYRVRDRHLEQITTDHTIGEAARHDPSLAEIARSRAHHLTRGVGIRENVDVDVVPAGPIHPGDRFLLCSDGLAPVPPEELVRSVYAYAPQDAADWLVAQASALGSRDNATAIIVQVESASPPRSS